MEIPYISTPQTCPTHPSTSCMKGVRSIYTKQTCLIHRITFSWAGRLFICTRRSYPNHPSTSIFELALISLVSGKNDQPFGYGRFPSPQLTSQRGLGFAVTQGTSNPTRRTIRVRRAHGISPRKYLKSCVAVAKPIRVARAFICRHHRTLG